VIDKIQAILDSYPSLSSSYLSIFKTITEYKTAFTTSLATYKTKREGYQAEYNGLIYLEEQLRELNDLQDLALTLKDVSSSIQAIIDQDTQKHSTDECTDLVESVEKFVNDIFNLETEGFQAEYNGNCVTTTTTIITT
jgi:dynactin complex subunit